MNCNEFLQHLPEITIPFAVLFGERTDYSVSPLMHNTAAKAYGHSFEYYGINIAKKEFNLIKDIISHSCFVGANITIPYKEEILSFATEWSELVSELNACNVLVKKNEQTFRAENTDVYGFISPLKEAFNKTEKVCEQAVIFGTGGASRAAAAGLKQLGIHNIYFVSRSPEQGELSYSNWQEQINKDLTTILVNGSPLGMTVYADKSPVSLEQIWEVKPLICYDLIYNPAETLFLQFARKAAVPIRLNGLEMLIQQASESYRIWNGIGFPFDVVRTALKETGLVIT